MLQLLRFRRDTEEDERRKLKIEKLSMKKKGIGSEARSEQLAKADADLQLLNHAEQERQMQKQKKRRLHGREEDVSFVNFVFILLEKHLSSSGKLNLLRNQKQHLFYLINYSADLFITDASKAG